MNRYEYLLLDADGTLLDFDADLRTAFAQVYRRHGYGRLFPDLPGALAIYRRHNAAWWERFNLGTCTKPEVERGGFAGFLSETGLSGDPELLKEEYDSLLCLGGVAYPGAKDLLEQLRGKYSLYLVTNGRAATAKARIRNAGLLPYFRDVFVSEEAGYAKPDIRYFEYVFSRIPGFQKEKALVVGDVLLADIQGANNAGIDSIWYDPGRAPNPRQIPYTRRAESYPDIVRYLSDE